MTTNLKKFRWTLSQHPIAYMSAEFGLNDLLPIFSGGLGMLAGDMIRAARGLELPMVGIGLLYREGYFKQIIDERGQTEEYPLIDTGEAPINLVVDTEGQPVKIEIPIDGCMLVFQIWEYREGDVPVFLLDTDLPENTDEYRLAIRRLYGGDRETRIIQEIVLGIGGAKTLAALNIHPSIYHLNEGHSAFAIFEITNHYMKEYKMTFQEAYEYSQNKIVFTNHTLVPAGNEVFSKEQITRYLWAYAKELGLPIEEVLYHGMSDNNDKNFSMTKLVFGMASRTNCVSQLHAKLAKDVWPEQKMYGITNGVDLPQWVSADFKTLAPKFDVEAIKQLEPAKLWRLHEMAKYRLIDEVDFRTNKKLDKDAIIITWARRFASYKRPEILLTDIERFKKIIFNTDYPIQFILAGKAHPADKLGHESIKNIVNMIKEHGLEKHVVFVPNYNMGLADALVSGSDVWLNTPILGKEACGTSGMKSAANGVLQCSVADGWMAEVDISSMGWELDDKIIQKQVYDIIEQQILPAYYDNRVNDLPIEWIKKMKNSIEAVWQKYSSRKMLEDYIDIMYAPTLELESKDKHYHNWRQRYRTKHVS